MALLLDKCDNLCNLLVVLALLHTPDLGSCAGRGERVRGRVHLRIVDGADWRVKLVEIDLTIHWRPLLFLRLPGARLLPQVIVLLL